MFDKNAMPYKVRKDKSFDRELSYHIHPKNNVKKHSTSNIHKGNRHWIKNISFFMSSSLNSGKQECVEIVFSSNSKQIRTGALN